MTAGNHEVHICPTCRQPIGRPAETRTVSPAQALINQWDLFHARALIQRTEAIETGKFSRAAWAGTARAVLEELQNLVIMQAERIKELNG